MNYHFLMLSSEVEDFRREYKLNSDATFQDLHDIIIESVNYKKDGISSFVICDDEWNREAEISLFEMDTDSDEDLLLMKTTRLSEFLEEEKQKFLFVFDFLTERAFYLELKEILFDAPLQKPQILKSEGIAPLQEINFDEIDLTVSTPSNIDSLDEDFYGEDQYNEDELDLERFEEY